MARILRGAPVARVVAAARGLRYYGGWMAW